MQYTVEALIILKWLKCLKKSIFLKTFYTLYNSTMLLQTLEKWFKFFYHKKKKQKKKNKQTNWKHTILQLSMLKLLYHKWQGPVKHKLYAPSWCARSKRRLAQSPVLQHPWAGRPRTLCNQRRLAETWLHVTFLACQSNIRLSYNIIDIWFQPNAIETFFCLILWTNYLELVLFLSCACKIFLGNIQWSNFHNGKP